MATLFKGYVIDTDAILHLVRRQYPPSIFKTIHSNIDKLIENGTLLSCREVLNELEAGNKKIMGKDEVIEWAKSKSVIFQELNEQEELIFADIVSRFPKLVKIDPPSGYDADAMLIAVAAEKGWKLITYEKGGDPNKVKIPDVAKEYNVECISLVELFEEQGWTN